MCARHLCSIIAMQQRVTPYSRDRIGVAKRAGKIQNVVLAAGSCEWTTRWHQAGAWKKKLKWIRCHRCRKKKKNGVLKLSTHIPRKYYMSTYVCVCGRARVMCSWAEGSREWPKQIFSTSFFSRESVGKVMESIVVSFQRSLNTKLKTLHACIV